LKKFIISSKRNTPGNNFSAPETIGITGNKSESFSLCSDVISPSSSANFKKSFMMKGIKNTNPPAPNNNGVF